MTAQLVLDVSNNNGVVNWDAVFSNGDVKAVYAKASQGVTFTDKYFGANRAAAAKHGKPFGAYHFYEPLTGATDQADHFATLVQKLGKTDLRPAIDVEVGASGLTPAALTAGVQLFSKRIKEHLGCYPVVYTDSGFLPNFIKAVGDGLWLANFGLNDGNEHEYPPPSPWKKALLHQFTSKGKWPGFSGGVDMSFAHGELPYAHPWLVRAL